MTSAPVWVVKGIQDILGLDDETIRQFIVPDLDSFTSDVRLRGHLEDFLGLTAPARAFTDRYVSHRFPSLATNGIRSNHSSRVPTPNSDLARVQSSSRSEKHSKSVTPRGLHAQSPETPQTIVPSSIPDALNAAFGSSGKVYQKTRDETLFPGRGGSGAGSARSAPGSGSLTPTVGASRYRTGGAVTIHEVRNKAGTEKSERNKGSEKIWDIPKSSEVKRLDSIVERLREVQGGEEKAVSPVAPCFCQARVHPISEYTPQCGGCGLVLCARQPAHARCPSCARPTLSPPALARLILRVQGDIEKQIAIEQVERDDAERARRERALADSGGGAFPTLPGQHTSKSTPVDPARRVLTLGKTGKGKGRATLTTTTYVSVSAPAVSSTGADAVVDPDDVVPRPRSLPIEPKRVAKELTKALTWRKENDRPWGNHRADKFGAGYTYIEAENIELAGEEGEGRRRKAKKKLAQGIGLDGRVVVGAR